MRFWRDVSAHERIMIRTHRADHGLGHWVTIDEPDSRPHTGCPVAIHADGGTWKRCEGTASKRTGFCGVHSRRPGVLATPPGVCNVVGEAVYSDA